MTVLSIIGFTAGICTTIAFVPQVIKIWETKSAKDLSLGMYSTLCLGLTLWLVYGFLISDLPIILANAVTLSLAMIILFFKFLYRN